MQVFEDRTDAGRRLAAALANHKELSDADRIVVLGVPRGGLPVGAEVASALGAPIDVVVVRKLRSPHNPELGFGAVGPNGHVEINQELVERLGLTDEEIADELADRRSAVDQRLKMYRDAAQAPSLEGAIVIVVDDGVATGGTARLACSYARHSKAERVLFATPVAPVDTVVALEDSGLADVVVALSAPAEFLSVGQAYADFTQLSDDDAVAALHQAPHRP